MNVITTFKEKRKEKQITYERKMLRELSLEGLKKNVSETFGSYFRMGTMLGSAIEEGCLDVAIEAYLLGAKYSRFSYYGESLEDVKKRCYQYEKNLIDALYEFICYWGHIGDHGFVNESLYYSCEHYVTYWWMEGFQKGEKRYRLKLH
ncbi:YbaK family protein [Fredinandcohnia sp. 179-A 10B2 NHS]|uniref:YbaK family protein n=1 Tax=Fredinandcohnia sp. 179-A 10B2 NHS TaxID=3235176 RepID=UPI0039A05DAF